MRCICLFAILAAYGPCDSSRTPDPLDELIELTLQNASTGTSSFTIKQDRVDFVALRKSPGVDLSLDGGMAVAGDIYVSYVPVATQPTITVRLATTGTFDIILDTFRDTDGDDALDPAADTLVGMHPFSVTLQSGGGGGGGGGGFITNASPILSFVGRLQDMGTGAPLASIDVHLKDGDDTVATGTTDASGRFTFTGLDRPGPFRIVGDGMWAPGTAAAIAYRAHDIGTYSIPRGLPHGGTVPLDDGKVKEDTEITGGSLTLSFRQGDVAMDAADSTMLTVNWTSVPALQFHPSLPDNHVNVGAFFIDMDAKLTLGADVRVATPGLIGIASALHEFDDDWKFVAGGSRVPEGLSFPVAFKWGGLFAAGLSWPAHVTLTGRVVDEGGNPIAGAVIATELAGEVATTQRDGTFEVQVGVLLGENTDPFDLRILVTAGDRPPVERTVVLETGDLGAEVDTGDTVLTGPARVTVQVLALADGVPQVGVDFEIPGYPPTKTDANGVATVHGVTPGTYTAALEFREVGVRILREPSIQTFQSEEARIGTPLEVLVLSTADPAGRVKAERGADVVVTDKATAQEYRARTTVDGVARFNLPSLDVRTAVTSMRIRDGQIVTIGGLFSSERIVDGKQVVVLRDMPRERSRVPTLAQLGLKIDNLPPATATTERQLFVFEHRSNQFVANSGFDDNNEATFEGKRVGAVAVTRTRDAPLAFNSEPRTVSVVPEITDEERPCIDHDDALVLSRLIDVALSGFPGDKWAQYLFASYADRFRFDLFVEPDRSIPVSPELPPAGVEVGLWVDVRPLGGPTAAIVAAFPGSRLPETMPVVAEMGPPAFTLDAQDDRIVLRFTPERACTYLFVYEDEQTMVTMVIDAPEAGVEIVEEFELPRLGRDGNFRAALACVDIDDVEGTTRTRLPPTAVSAAFVQVGFEGIVSHWDHWIADPCLYGGEERDEKLAAFAAAGLAFGPGAKHGFGPITALVRTELTENAYRVVTQYVRVATGIRK